MSKVILLVSTLSIVTPRYVGKGHKHKVEDVNFKSWLGHLVVKMESSQHHLILTKFKSPLMEVC